jgi:serine/threonine-protein kinase
VPGRYRLEGEIARGGMGAVLKGVDTDLGRDIAVKVLLQTHAGKTELLHRFVEEAQIGGQLQHPGIVPVYDLGQFGDKRPYFTMKLVKGQTLARLLAERRGPAEELPRFVGVFEQVCQTVAYAHARGVIHRDLKPANVMVGAFGEVQVMDWGLAKVLTRSGGVREGAPAPEEVSVVQTRRSAGAEAASGQTEVGSVLGTPAYMAPEQARGEVERIDERADVFGLGAILCQILTGEAPFASATGEAMRLAQRADLADAFARLDGCGADVELVALAKRCLAAQPEGRPRDAGAVAEAVIAYQRSVAERLRRAEMERAQAEVKAGEERKRRRLAVGLGAALVCLLLGASGAGLWYQREQARRAAEQEREQARRAAEEARRVADVEREASAALREAATLRERTLRLTEKLGEWKATLGLARSALARAQRGLEKEPKADARLRDQAEETAAVLTADARDLRLLAAFEKARKAEAEVDVVRSEFKTRRTYASLKAALVKYGLPAGRLGAAEVARRVGRRPGAVRAKVVAILGECLMRGAGRGAPERRWFLDVLARLDPDPWRGRVRSALARRDRRALVPLAKGPEVERQGPDFLVQLARALPNEPAGLRIDLLRRAQQLHPGDFWLQHHLAYELEGSVSAPAGRPPVAESAKRAALNEAVRHYTAALALRPDNTGVYVNLSSVLRAIGDPGGAVRAARKAIRLAPGYLAAHGNFGAALLDKNDFDGAEAAYRKAIALLNRSGAGARRPAAIYHNGLGLALRGKKDFEGAAAALRKALALDPKLGHAHHNLGLVRLDQQDLPGARAAFQKASDLDPGFAAAHFNLGLVLLDLGEPAGAEKAFRKAVAANPGDGEFHAGLAEALLALGKFTEARQSAAGGLDRMTQRHPKRAALARIRDLCERLVPLERKLPALLRGEALPRDAGEGLALAELCLEHKQLYRSAVRFYSGAFEADPKLAASLRPPHGYQAASAAVLAAAGQGKETDKPNDKERARLRALALGWLRAALKIMVDGVEKVPEKASPFVRAFLTHWQKVEALATVRGKDALAKLPEGERAGWQKLWADVEAVRKKAQAQLEKK